MIVSLKDCTEQQKQEIFQEYERFLTEDLGLTTLKPSEEFNALGSKFPKNHLLTLNLNLIYFPLEIMSDYVDKMTKTAMDNNDAKYINSAIGTLNLSSMKSIQLNNMNATTLGNLSYIALNCQNPTLAALAEKELNRTFQVVSIKTDITLDEQTKKEKLSNIQKKLTEDINSFQANVLKNSINFKLKSVVRTLTFKENQIFFDDKLINERILVQELKKMMDEA